MNGPSTKAPALFADSVNVGEDILPGRISVTVTVAFGLAVPVIVTLVTPTVGFVGETVAVIWTPPETPCPESATVCGEPDAPLLEIVRVALLDPVDPGVNPTCIWQDCPALSALVQLLLTAKSLAFVPVMDADGIAIEPLPPFCIVTDCLTAAVPIFWLPKLSDDGVTDMTGVAIVTVRFDAADEPPPGPAFVTTIG